ncbi:endonuclease domain-containing protein [Candidatus Bipolaricaulota bacterium]|nr:endonuclease domain-containing protein [Candidatus Bipolaricaulota bacterium]
MASRKDLIARARRMRCQATDAERLLWQKLRGRQLGVKFRRQAPIGPYIVDFVCFEKRLVVELDGSQHGLPPRRAYDAQRSRWLRSQGFRVLRFWDSEVLIDIEGVLRRILQELEGRA